MSDTKTQVVKGVKETHIVIKPLRNASSNVVIIKWKKKQISTYTVSSDFRISTKLLASVSSLLFDALKKN